MKSPSNKGQYNRKKSIIAAGGIVWRQTNSSGDLEFLILQHKYGKYWSFPKGRQIKGETYLDTAKREIHEETGISEFKLLEKFSKSIKYFVRRGKRFIPKEVRYFLVQFSKTVEINLSAEHIAYKWLKFDDAISQITHDNSKELLSEVYSQLKKRNDFEDEDLY